MKKFGKNYIRLILTFISISLISVFMVYSMGCSRSSSDNEKEQQSTTLEKISETVKQTTTIVDDETTSHMEESADESNYEQIMKQFEDLKSLYEPPFKLIELLDANFNTLEIEQLGMLFDSLELYMLESQDRYTNILLSDYEKYQIPLFNQFAGDINTQDIESIEDEELRNLVDEIYKSGYRLVGLEGSFYPIIDYQTFIKYTDFLPEEHSSYILIQAQESEKVSMADAALLITWDDVAQRLINIEKFVVSFPDSSKKETMSSIFFRYLTSYFYGIDNSPAYDYSTYEFFPEVIESYETAIADFNGTVVAELVSEYLSAAENNNYILNDNVRQTAEDLIKQAEQQLNITNPFNF